jgi:hypothetical protein
MGIPPPIWRPETTTKYRTAVQKKNPNRAANIVSRK